MAAYTAGQVSISNGSKAVVINSDENPESVAKGDFLFLSGSDPKEINRTYINDQQKHVIELIENWDSGNKTNQPAIVLPTTVEFRDTVAAIKNANLLINDNMQAMSDWQTQEGEVVFTGLDSNSYTFPSLKALQQQVDAVVAEANQATTDTILAASDVRRAETPMLSVPFNDGLGIEHGYGEHDKLDISAAQDGSLVVDLPTKSADYTALGVRWNFNKAGVFEELSPGEPAITEKGLYLNAEYTNYQPNNTQMHLLSTTSLTLSEVETDTPIGNTCTEVVESNDLNEHFINLVNLPAVEGDFYNFSAFVKAGSSPGSRGVMLRTIGTNETARFDVSEEGIFTIKSGSMVELERHSDGWYRISFSLKAAATGNIGFRFQLTLGSDSSYMGETTGSVFIVGAQITKTRYLRPLVLTAGSAATTPETSLTLPIAGNAPTDGGAFTVAIDVDMHMDRGDVNYESFFTLGTPTTYLGLESNNAGAARLTHSLGAWDAFNFNENTETGINRLVIVYSPTSKGGSIKTFHNGDKIRDREYTGDGLEFPINGVINLSAPRSGVINRDGHVKNLKILNYAASESEIASWGAPK